MSIRYGLVLVLAALFLAGCVDQEQSRPPAPAPQSSFTALFAPLGAQMPFPNDLYFAGSKDGTLNVPVTNPDSPLAGPIQAINRLDGYATQAPIYVYFTAPIDESTIVGGKTVHVFAVNKDPKTKAVVGFDAMLVPGEDYKAGVSSADSSILVIKPLHPLDTASAYEVVLTQGIKSVSGEPAVADSTYAAIKKALATGGTLDRAKLDKIKLLEGAMLKVASAVGIKTKNVILTFSFSTQSAGVVLNYIEEHSKALGGTLKFTGLTTGQVNPRLKNNADVYVGFIKVPWYLPVPTSENPLAPLTGHWSGKNGSALTRYNPDPVKTATLKIPVLITIPNENSAYMMRGGVKPPTGWPVVIFQHGITGNRTNMLAIAGAFADVGFAVVAIDLPLHGITNPKNPFYQKKHELTFNLDVQNNKTGAPKPDGKIDPSGSHFINLQSLLTSRDNLRQAVADLISLTDTLPTLDYNHDDANDFNVHRIYFVGLSLGAMAGIPYLAVDETPISATLASPGGHVAKLLRKSPTFGPRIRKGLAAQGLQPGSQLFLGFFRSAQTVVGAGDPSNYAAEAAEKHPIHMTEIVGSPGSPPDQVIPNFSTDILVDAMDLKAIHDTTINPDGVRGIVRFLFGSHASLLDPSASRAATVEMQTETVIFAAGHPPTIPGNGRAIVITHQQVVK